LIGISYRVYGIGDFSLYHSIYNFTLNLMLFSDLFWRAPEELRSPQRRGSPKGDVYAFGIILHEIFGRWGPFGFCNMVPKGSCTIKSFLSLFAHFYARSGDILIMSSVSVLLSSAKHFNLGYNF
jgi:serine/threonine protein kinase